MSNRWRYYNSKRSGFRGRGRGRGRGTSLTAVSLPRDDPYQNGELYRDRAMDPSAYRDETVLSISFGRNVLGAALYEQSPKLLKIMNDISEDEEFKYIKRLIDDVKPTMILANRSQDLNFINFLSSRYEVRESVDAETTDTTIETIPQFDASLAYSREETTVQNDKDDEDEALEEHKAKLFKLPNHFFKMTKALDRLKVLVGSENAAMSDEDKYTIVTMRFDIEAVNMMRALGALLLFLDEARLGVESEPLTLRTPVKSIKTLTLQNLVDIDFNSIQALDILPKESDSKKTAGQRKSLFELMDGCRSMVGKRCLRKWFRNPTTDREELLFRQKCVHFFKQDWNAEVTAKLMSVLGKIKPMTSIFVRFQSGSAQLIHWEGFVSTVNALVEITTIIKQTSISAELKVEEDVLKDVSEIAVIAGSIINFEESKIKGKVTVMPGVDAELDQLRVTYENMPMVLTEVAKQEAERLGLGQFGNATCVYVPLVGFILSLPRDFPVENHPDMSLVYATSDELRVKNTTTEKLEEEFGDILMKLIDNQTAIMLSLKTRVMKRKRSINKVLATIAKIDALISLGIVAAVNGWNCPTLVEEPVIEAAELFHPISALVVKKHFVPNAVSSGRDEVKVSIITGPNACGKSVYMKSIGILAFLTHIGSFVPARHAKVGTIDRIVTRMFTVDSVLDGMSTFAKDVEQVALALRKATANSLVIIDEFGKGTMTEVGLSLLASCMNHWMQRCVDRCPHVFLSSHFHALPRYIPLETNLATFLTFTVLREPGGKVKHLFQLAHGMVDCSFAMAVAKEEGIPMSVIGRACRIYKALKSGTPLSDVRAEVINTDEETHVSDMEAVLENEQGFMDAVESFVKREKAALLEEQCREDTSRLRSRERVEEEPPSSEQLKISEEKTRTSSVATILSTKPLSSMDQLSIFDALLPVKKKRKDAEVQERKIKTQETDTPPRSPDPFSIDGEEEHQVTSNKLIPLMQRLSSEEKKSESTRKDNVNHATALKKKVPEERIGLKRARSPSISNPVEKQKTRETVNKSFKQSMFNTPINERRNNSSSVEPRQSSARRGVTDKSIENSQFKTPMNPSLYSKNNSSEKSILRTPSQKSKPPQSLSDSQLDAIFNTSPTSKRSVSNHSILFGDTQSTVQSTQKPCDPDSSQRSSSRRGIREEDKSPGGQWDIFSRANSQLSIFKSQQSQASNSTKNPRHSSADKSAAQESLRSKAYKPSRIQKSDISSQTPTSKMSEKQRSFQQQKVQASRQTISPSSVILGELLRGDDEKTPLPLGDRLDDEEFEFNPTDDDPIYGKKKARNSPDFEFMKSDDEDEEFLNSFLESEKSLEIYMSGESSINKSSAQ
ncbi:unnamed protein product [Caenorhabditis sp. 36 PRJEB53466]|nr:unnamed protein product [Caenorhabditis sp. 36 PRJEB53466]